MTIAVFISKDIALIMETPYGYFKTKWWTFSFQIFI